MTRIWNKAMAIALATLLAGCATDKQHLLPSDTTMLDIWDRQTGGSTNATHAARQLIDARAALRRPVNARDGDKVLQENTVYTRNARNEIYSQFRRLPNPDLVMFVFAHLAGTDPVPVPGYTTVFPFYQRVQYALPGERTEAY